MDVEPLKKGEKKSVHKCSSQPGSLFSECGNNSHIKGVNGKTVPGTGLWARGNNNSEMHGQPPHYSELLIMEDFP